MHSSDDLTVEAFIAIAQRLTYKPGWTLTFTKGLAGPSGGFERMAVGECRRIEPDAGDPTRTVPVMAKKAWSVLGISASEGQTYVTHVIGAWLLEMERHEFREWFRWDGRPIDPPHDRLPNG